MGHETLVDYWYDKEYILQMSMASPKMPQMCKNGFDFLLPQAAEVCLDAEGRLSSELCKAAARNDLGLLMDKRFRLQRGNRESVERIPRSVDNSATCETMPFKCDR